MKEEKTIMTEERICDCGSVADWEEIGSTWICTACRGKNVRELIDRLKRPLMELETVESALRIYKVDTTALSESLGKLEDEIHNIEEMEEDRIIHREE